METNATDLPLVPWAGSTSWDHMCPKCASIGNSVSDHGLLILGYTVDLEQRFKAGCKKCGLILGALYMYSENTMCSVDEISASWSNTGLVVVNLQDVRGFDIKVEIFTLPETQAQWPSLRVGRIRQTYTGAKVYLDYILAWIDECMEKHDLCKQDQEQYVPQRVLDVGTVHSDTVCVVEARDIEARGKYMCLSHCWGSFKPLCTTRKTITAHKNGIPFAMLPPTFRDTVALTRYLGVRYLFIDSLCIIQDSFEDWVEQSSRMGDIYRNSFLTISATASADALGGLFRMTPAEYVEIPDPVIPGASTGIFARDPIIHGHINQFVSSGQDHLPLLTRAWAYQEHLLSPRVLYFGDQELLWQCNQHTRCCCSANPDANPFSTKSLTARALVNVKNTHLHSGSELRECWRDISQYYSNKAITKEEDRLPALSGIAKRFQAGRKSVYLAGLFEDDLVHGLSWRVPAQPGKRPQKYLGPSWSWVSVIGMVDWWGSGPLSRIDVEVHEVSCTPASSDPTGAVSFGFIRLSGILVPGTVSFLSHNPWRSTSFNVKDVSHYLLLDAIDDDWDRTEEVEYPLCGLRIGAASLGASLQSVALLLRSTGPPHAVFQRVGIMYVDDSEWDEGGAEKREITIV